MYGRGRGGVLQLTALTMRRHNHVSGDLGGMGGTVVPAYQMQAEVDPGSRARACRDIAKVDVQDVGVDLDVREAGAEFGGHPPVRGGPTLIEQPGLREQESTGTDRDKARAAPVCPPQRVNDGRWGWLLAALPAGEHHRVGRVECLQPRVTAISYPAMVGTLPGCSAHTSNW
ncbi:hypothetical protein GCM10029963_77240 [Micromonospora andamanensis]